MPPELRKRAEPDNRNLEAELDDYFQRKPQKQPDETPDSRPERLDRSDDNLKTNVLDRQLDAYFG